MVHDDRWDPMAWANTTTHTQEWANTTTHMQEWALLIALPRRLNWYGALHSRCIARLLHFALAHVAVQHSRTLTVLHSFTIAVLHSRTVAALLSSGWPYTATVQDDTVTMQSLCRQRTVLMQSQHSHCTVHQHGCTHPYCRHRSARI